MVPPLFAVTTGSGSGVDSGTSLIRWLSVSSWYPALSSEPSRLYAWNPFKISEEKNCHYLTVWTAYFCNCNFNEKNRWPAIELGWLTCVLWRLLQIPQRRLESHLGQSQSTITLIACFYVFASHLHVKIKFFLHPYPTADDCFCSNARKGIATIIYADISWLETKHGRYGT